MTSPLERPSAAALTTGVRSGAEPTAVTPHHMASQAAIDVMHAGGNAVDGAVAANAMQGVVAPETCGIGGDLFALIHIPGEAKPLTLNASGHAGSGISAEALRSQSAEIPLRHPATVTTPGCVDGWIELSTKHGRLSLDTVLQPAIDAARNGFTASLELSGALERLRSLIGSQGSAPSLYRDGRSPDAGDRVIRPRLASTLETVASGDRGAFYGGEVGAAITQATSGIVTPDDLAASNMEWVDPIGIDLFGHKAWTVPPNTQGYIGLAALWILQQLDPPRDPSDPRFVHASIEAYRSIAWERDDLVADPVSAPIAASELLSPARLAAHLDTVSMERSGAFPKPQPAPGGTAYMCVRDADGMGVSLIQSNFWGIGSGLSAGDTGVWLHNRGAGFNLIPGHPNEYNPGRRPLHTLSPTLWTKDNGLSMILGTRGGQFQPQLIVQTTSAMLHAGMAPAAAQHHPRWQVAGWEVGATPVVALEDRFDRRVDTALSASGHTTTRAMPWEGGWGPVSIITESNGLVSGAADPRVSTSAAL